MKEPDRSSVRRVHPTDESHATYVHPVRLDEAPASVRRTGGYGGKRTPPLGQRDRVPPINDLDAEGSVLSAALNDSPRGWLGALTGLLRPEMFYATANQRIWEAVEALHCRGKPTDPVSVAGYMRQRGTLLAAGGTPYLGETLALCQPACAKPEAHAALILECWKERELVTCMERTAIELRHGSLTHEGAKLKLREHFLEMAQATGSRKEGGTHGQR